MTGPLSNTWVVNNMWCLCLLLVLNEGSIDISEICKLTLQAYVVIAVSYY